MSTSDTTNSLLTANRQLASYFTQGRSASAENGLVFPRGNAYGEQVVQLAYGSKLTGLADEGSLFVATNTPQTAIADTAALTAFAATTPTMIVFNSNSVASNKFIYPQRFRMSVAAAGTNGTNWLTQWLVDTGNRLTSGGTTLTGKSVNPNVTTSSGATITFGAITATAATASKIVSASLGRTVIKVVGDEYTWEFGSSAPASATGMPSDGTLQLQKLFQLPAIAIPPQCSLLFYEYAASQSVAATFDNIVLEYIER
jgi:hypothetical protein